LCVGWRQWKGWRCDVALERERYRSLLHRCCLVVRLNRVLVLHVNYHFRENMVAFNTLFFWRSFERRIRIIVVGMHVCYVDFRREVKGHRARHCVARAGAGPRVG
jgi:hypothetical protein